MSYESKLIEIGRRDIIFLLAAALYIYTQLFELPATPIYFDGDFTHSVSNALRMLDGEVIYRDFFHFTTPGAETVYCFLFSVFGPGVWITNALILILGLCQAGLCWYFSRKVLSGWLAYLPPAIFLVIGYRQFGLDASNRLFSVGLALGAVALLISGRSLRRLAGAGVLCGLSTFFVQPRGVVVLLAIISFLVWEAFQAGSGVRASVQQSMVVVTAFVITSSLTQLYFLVQAGWDAYYFAMVTYPSLYYGYDPLNNLYAYLSDISSFSISNVSDVRYVAAYIRQTHAAAFYYLLIPAIYLIFAFFRFGMRTKPIDKDIRTTLTLLAFAGVFLAFGTSAPTATRLYHVSLPGLVILIWLCSQQRTLRRTMPLAAVALSLLGAAYAVQRQLVEKHFLDMPAGRAAFLYRPLYERYEWMRDNTRPGDVVYEPHHPNFYFPMHLKNPAPLYMARDTEYTPRFHVDAVVNALEKRPPRLIIWPAVWSKPANERAPGDNLGPLWDFVLERYERRHIFPAFDLPIQTIHTDSEVWELKR